MKNKKLVRNIIMVGVVVSTLTGLFLGVYKYHSNQLDANLKVSKEMVSKMDDDKITYIKITTKDILDYYNVAV